MTGDGLLSRRLAFTFCFVKDVSEPAACRYQLKWQTTWNLKMSIIIENEAKHKNHHLHIWNMCTVYGVTIFTCWIMLLLRNTWKPVYVHLVLFCQGVSSSWKSIRKKFLHLSQKRFRPKTKIYYFASISCTHWRNKSTDLMYVQYISFQKSTTRSLQFNLLYQNLCSLTRYCRPFFKRPQ